MYRYLFALLMLLPLCAWAQSSVYRTVDENGNVVFTDAPPAGGQTERVELSPTNTVAPPEMPVREPESKEAGEVEAEDLSVSIVSPENETTIAMGPGNFSVNAELSGAGAAKKRLQLFVDGAPHGVPQADATWALTNVYRGAHDLTVSVLDSNGTALATSEPVRVYVLRPSVNFRNRQPVSRPTPNQ